MIYSLGADTGPGAGWCPPDHHNFLWSFPLQERQTVLPPLCGQSCLLLWAHAIWSGGDHVWGDSASCWGGILLGQGHPYSCYSEIWSLCPDTWGGRMDVPLAALAKSCWAAQVLLWCRLCATANLPRGKDVIGTFEELLSFVSLLFAFTL